MRKHVKRDHIHILNIIIFSVFLITTISYVPKIDKPLSQYSLLKKEEKKEEKISLVFNKKLLENLDIRANAYVVYDILNKEVIVGKNKNELLPLASISKIMMALTSVSMADKDQAIIISDKSIDGGYDLGLKKNQSWRLDELLKYTLVFSSNDGAQAIADNLGGRESFVQRMNDKAKELFLNMSFTNPAGLDLEGKIGGVGSALDVARMMALAEKVIPDILDSTTHTRATAISSIGRIYGIPNTNQEVNDFLGIMASKTGYTDRAGGNLALVVDITLGHPVVIVVLGSTRSDRFSDAFTLYNALKQSLYLTSVK